MNAAPAEPPERRRPSLSGLELSGLELSGLEPVLAAVPGTVSVWCGHPGQPAAWQREPAATHYAASTMKVAVLAALYRAGAAGRLDLDRPIPVCAEFASALAGAPPFAADPEYDNDPEPWARIGGRASLGWLAERMIVRSSNLATNIVLSHVGLAAVAEVWRLVGARHSVVGRGIGDRAAGGAGMSNLVTAADLAALLAAIVTGATTPSPAAPPDGHRPQLADPAACAAMLEILLAQEYGEDLAAGLPAGTRIAHKNGWIEGVRHGAGVVFPSDADPYTLVVCTTTELADEQACALLTRVAAASWADRHRLGRVR